MLAGEGLMFLAGEGLFFLAVEGSVVLVVGVRVRVEAESLQLLAYGPSGN